MFIQCDLEKMSLRLLYELMTFKTGEFQAIRNYNGNYKEQQSEIELLQRVINDKKVKPINSNPDNLETS
jgi:hypothetical protein